MSSIFNLQRAFDPRHLSIDREESEPIVVRGVHTVFFFFPPHVPVSGTHDARPDTGAAKYPPQFMANPRFDPFLNSKTFFVLQL